MNTLTRSFVIVLSVVMFATLSTWAGPVEIPYEFIPGEKAKAGEVNANFTAVENAVNDNDTRLADVENAVDDHDTRLDTLENQSAAVKQIHQGDTYIELPISCGEISSITVTPPADGYVMVTATGTLSVDIQMGTGGICLDLSDSEPPASCNDCDGVEKPAISLTIYNDFTTPYSIVEVYPVSGESAVSFYMYGYAQFCTGKLSNSSLTALFVPNELPVQ